MNGATIVQEWDSDRFHHRLLEIESEGYVARQETYTITADMDPETGRIVHLHKIEVYRTDET
jgi:hypothetical protein